MTTNQVESGLAYKARGSVETSDREAADELAARLARDLYDITAHTIAVIAIQAGVAEEALAGCPEPAREAIRAIRASSRQALAELKATVATLREGTAARGRLPGLMMATYVLIHGAGDSAWSWHLPAADRSSGVGGPSPDVARPPVADQRGGQVQVAGGGRAQHQHAAVVFGGAQRAERSGDEGRPLPVLPTQPLIEAGDRRAVRQGAQLVALLDDPVGFAQHQRGMALPAAVGPGRDPFHVAGVQWATLGDQPAAHHGRVRHDLAPFDGKNMEPAHGVVPVVLGEPIPERLAEQPAQGLQRGPGQVR